MSDKNNDKNQPQRRQTRSSKNPQLLSKEDLPPIRRSAARSKGKVSGAESKVHVTVEKQINKPFVVGNVLETQPLSTLTETLTQPTHNTQPHSTNNLRTSTPIPETTLDSNSYSYPLSPTPTSSLTTAAAIFDFSNNETTTTVTMATVQELETIINQANQQSQQAAAQQATINAENMRLIVKTQTETTKEIMDALVQEMKAASALTDKNDKRKLLTRNLTKPKKFSILTRLISIERFVKQYREFVDKTCGKENGAYADYLRPFLDGQAADWYDAHVDGDMANDFDAIVTGMRKRFERESYKADSYIPKQEDQTVTEFYEHLVSIATSQNWSTEKQLHLFHTGIADKFKTSLEARHPRTLTDAYDMALVIEADKGEIATTQKEEKSIVEVLTEAVAKLATSKQDYSKIATEDDVTQEDVRETVRAFRRFQKTAYQPATPQVQQAPYSTPEARRLQNVENSLSQISGMLQNMQAPQAGPQTQSMSTYQNRSNVYGSQYSQPSHSAYQNSNTYHQNQPTRPLNQSSHHRQNTQQNNYFLPPNYSNPNPRYHGWNYNPNYTSSDKRPSQHQSQHQSQPKHNQQQREN